MTIKIPTLMGATLLLLGACGGNPSPVPVLGSGGDIAGLVGEWTGEYRSIETGRSGSIFFRLEAGADTAAGDVLMVPADRAGHDHPEGVHPPSEYIAITFVRIRNGAIRGTLDPYLDPVCGCRLETTFEGIMRADTISGTYTSRHLDAARVQTGQWFAIRSRTRP